MRRQSRFPFKKLSRRFDFGNQDPKNIIRVVEKFAHWKVVCFLRRKVKFIYIWKN
jgi:hypothetical protein